MPLPQSLSLNFILSVGRSGSTLLSSMLNMHTNIISTIEEPFAYTLFPKYKEITNWDDKIIAEFCYDFFLFSEGKLEPQFSNKNELYRILKENQKNLTGELAIKLSYLAFFPNKDKSTITTIVDKQLKFHNLLTDVISFYPKSKFIVLIRDPRDNILVKMKRSKKKKKSINLYRFSKDWACRYSNILQTLNLINPSSYLLVKYEDLMVNPEKELTKITSFLGVKYEENMLNYVKKNAEVTAENYTQISSYVKDHLSLMHNGLTKVISTEKIGLWNNELAPSQSNMIWSICGETALKFGYEKNNSEHLNYKLKEIKNIIFFNLTETYTKMYYKMPFWLKYMAKKLKYRNNFKTSKYTTSEFLRSLGTNS